MRVRRTGAVIGGALLPVVVAVGGLAATGPATKIDNPWGGADVASGSGATFGAATLPIANPRGTAAALAWARAQVGGPAIWRELCLNFTARAYGWDHAGTQYAIDHFVHEMPRSMQHWGQRNAPAGSLMFWDTGKRAGHVALSLGDGYIASNDINSVGRISVVLSWTIDERWGARYLGWAPPYFPDGIAYSDPAAQATPPAPAAKPAPSARPARPEGTAPVTSPVTSPVKAPSAKPVPVVAKPRPDAAPTATGSEPAATSTHKRYGWAAGTGGSHPDVDI